MSTRARSSSGHRGGANGSFSAIATQMHGNNVDLGIQSMQTPPPEIPEGLPSRHRWQAEELSSWILALHPRAGAPLATCEPRKFQAQAALRAVAETQLMT